MVSKMSINEVKNRVSPNKHEGNKGRFRFCHPDTKKFQLIDYQLVGFFYCGYLVSKTTIYSVVGEKCLVIHELN